MATPVSLPFICGTIHWSNRASYVIEYIYEKCTQGAHRFFVVAPDIANEPDYADYESPISYKYECQYCEDADIEGFTDRIRKALFLSTNLFIDYETKQVLLDNGKMEQKLNECEWLNVIRCTEKSGKFYSKIIIAAYDEERRLDKYGKSYLDKYYQRIDL